MNKRAVVFRILIFFSIFSSIAFISFQTEPWKPDQLLAPSVLAASIQNNSSDKPLIISVGPAGLIKGSVEMGPADKKENLNKLRNFLSGQKKNREVVIYCGCCPFADCPNIRPAFTLLNEMKFTHHKLLNLPHNLRVDWINNGFPEESKR